MSAFLNITNHDNIFERCAIVALLKDFEDKVVIDYINKNEVKKINVPFYFQLQGSERYLMDKYMNDIVRDEYGKFAETQYDVVPRGVVIYNNSVVNNSERTNPYVKAIRLKKNSEGELVQYYQPLKSIPLTLSFDIQIKGNHNKDLMSISQKLREIYDYPNVLQFEYEGIRVPAIWILPESFEREKTFEYTQGDNVDNFLKFSIDMKTFQPVFNDNDSIFAGNRMQAGIVNNIIVDQIPLDNNNYVDEEGYNKKYK